MGSGAFLKSMDSVLAKRLLTPFRGALVARRACAERRLPELAMSEWPGMVPPVTARKLKPYHVIRYRPALPGAAGANAVPVPAYRQTRNYCCGFATTLMVAHHFDAPVAGRELFENLGTARDGTRQGAIVRELRALGMRVNVRYDVDFDRIRREIDRGKLIIGYLVDAEHWVVIYGYAHQPERLYIADPRPEVECEHAWEAIAPCLRRFGMVCSRAAQPRAALWKRPSIPTAGKRERAPREGEEARCAAVQLSFDFGS